MNRILELAELVSSKLGHPRVALSLSNYLLKPQDVELQEGAIISKNTKVRGNIRLGPHSKLSTGCVLMGDIEIGEWTNINQNTEVVGEVSFGKYCAIARDVLFQQKNHQTSKPAMQMRFYNKVLDSKLEHVSSGPISVGNDVWIGARSIILSGVDIGDGAVIGAGSIVTEDVEPYSVVAGVPAKHIKYRFPQDVRKKLINLSWWEHGEEIIKENRKFFEKDIQNTEDIPGSF
ncbi:CatB-related O-acetyltransferase [Haloterrigena alkaliphila]|uniref:Antibiotic acetyltransferase n=1 Tax=Haloterrigena alkaliphila TaxID=2816475 RepID=A0A8A2VDP8_9EURY|nr:CatB-related O-acetyltransferase [Haloterrigena alkaliphila]QSW99641.1 CatB-related O-acetyltransferase [Haloterrigena alkaliphila]